MQKFHHENVKKGKKKISLFFLAIHKVLIFPIPSSLPHIRKMKKRKIKYIYIHICMEENEEERKREREKEK